MQSTEIRDAQINASSNYDVYYRDNYARLNHPTSFWRTDNSDNVNPWLQIDFLSETIVNSIETQGGSTSSRVETYTVSYGNDGVTFQIYKENGVDKVKQLSVSFFLHSIL